MLHHKGRLHAEMGAFFDGEGFRLEGFDGAGSGQVDGDVRSTFDFEGERFDHAASLISGVDCDGWGGGDAQGGFPAVEGFVVFVCGGLSDGWVWSTDS